MIAARICGFRQVQGGCLSFDWSDVRCPRSCVIINTKVRRHLPCDYRNAVANIGPSIFVAAQRLFVDKISHEHAGPRTSDIGHRTSKIIPPIVQVHALKPLLGNGALISDSGLRLGENCYRRPVPTLIALREIEREYLRNWPLPNS